MKILIFGSALGQFQIRLEKLIMVSSGLRKKKQPIALVATNSIDSILPFTFQADSDFLVTA